MSDQHNEALINFMRRGGSLHVLADRAPEDLALLYRYCIQLCEGDEYENAKVLLTLLVHLDHHNFSYWQTLGQCYKQTCDYHQAIYCFSRSGQICVDDPRPSCLAGECYLACGNQAYAEKAFRAALNWCCVHPEMNDIRVRAENGLASLTLEV
ncbi:CesD/SycD/LcrH family type III secretion system chaperone [Candidatus Fukatsuia symbiotica]|uniref:CesD/SycD/LcrH family type III secretion system chaperone n=1 Tax=Candidatus Fukatsuia symbiotica TaxID=1878942 RepID=A0A2U8I4B9_9GAMM|nr:CesD/SycD/LcrH family type III secretion system chaperone [Candidatus Fukatsuia symbiotica]AWK13983.1 CesD/SycD/LcrH family type III secretion system chaperone [Candidatus Fukatsuia symbiotica]MEA9445672.1 CesD/SycD/LcrH family type III secretion system chaperone [Candidatus Fukatsuia symbiotica]